MHIVLANQWFPPESGWGGVAMYNLSLARAFVALGHQVTVVASQTAADVPRDVMREGMRILRLPVRDAFRLRRLPLLGRYVRPLQQLAYSRRVGRALRDLQRAQPIDVVEFAEINAEGFFYTRAPRAMCAPVVVRCHTPTAILARYYLPGEMPFDTRILAWCEREMTRRAHALSAPSAHTARMAAELFQTCQPVAPIPNALALDRFSGAAPPPAVDGAITILYVGRLDRVKGVNVLVDAIPRVVASVPEARFVFAGQDRLSPTGGSQRAELSARLAATGMSGRVEFLGAISQEALLDWYVRADFCVAPSILYESFSYTCAQAMAAGRAVVATRIGGIPETVTDGVTGLLVDPGQAEPLGEAIITLARDPARRAQYGHVGRARVARDFDPLVVARQTLDVYARACARFAGTECD